MVGDADVDIDAGVNAKLHSPSRVSTRRTISIGFLGSVAHNVQVQESREHPVSPSVSRAARDGVQSARSQSEQERIQGLLEERRHVTHTVVEMQEQAERYFRVVTAYRNEINEFCRAVNLSSSEGRTPDAFDVSKE